MKHKGNKAGDQSGFASIVIALILVLVMSLLTVAFSQLARREQRSALDKQLSTQAYYAAESGINDVIKNLDAVNALDPPPNQCLTQTQLTTTGITTSSNYRNGGVSVSPANNAVSYACVLVNAKPDSLLFKGVSPEEQKSSKFSVSGGLDDLTISWASADPARTTPRTAAETAKFSPKASWNSPGVLQVSITPLNNMTRDGLIANTATVFLYPGPGGAGTGTVLYSDIKGALKGSIVNGYCGNPGDFPCKATIQTIGGGGSTDQYLVRILNYYTASDITVDAKDLSNTKLQFLNAQAKIDVTGRSRDVLKRVQVRSPIKQPIEESPGFTLEGQSICKRTSTYTGQDTLNPPDLTAATSAACSPWAN